MTPEERAQAVVENREPFFVKLGVFSIGTWPVSHLEKLIADAIRAAEDDVYDECVNEARRGENGHDPSERIAAAIRAKKTR